MAVTLSWRFVSPVAATAGCRDDMRQARAASIRCAAYAWAGIPSRRTASSQARSLSARSSRATSQANGLNQYATSTRSASDCTSQSPSCDVRQLVREDGAHPVLRPAARVPGDSYPRTRQSPGGEHVGGIGFEEEDLRRIPTAAAAACAAWAHVGSSSGRARRARRRNRRCDEQNPAEGHDRAGEPQRGCDGARRRAPRRVGAGRGCDGSDGLVALDGVAEPLRHRSVRREAAASACGSVSRIVHGGTTMPRGPTGRGRKQPPKRALRAAVRRGSGRARGARAARGGAPRMNGP